MPNQVLCNGRLRYRREECRTFLKNPSGPNWRALALHSHCPAAPGKNVPAQKDPETAKRFASLKERLTVPTSENLRLAVIEGDALVDSFLKRAGYEGEHMADRLSQLSAGEVPALERLWDAHRLRNNIVHTPGAAISSHEARAAMKAYEDFLKELGAL